MIGRVAERWQHVAPAAARQLANQFDATFPPGWYAIFFNLFVLHNDLRADHDRQSATFTGTVDPATGRPS